LFLLFSLARLDSLLDVFRVVYQQRSEQEWPFVTKGNAS